MTAWLPGPVVVLAVIIGSGVASAMQRDKLDAAPPVPVGTAVIAGRVTTSETGDIPVGRAVLTLVAADGVETHSTVADADGRFALTALRAGRYTLLAKKGGHLTSSYGARRPGRPGTTLIVAEGARLMDLRIALPKGGVITGAVRLANGDLLPNTQIVAIPVSLVAARGRTVNVRRFETDDRGIYRIHGLAPGEYIVAAVPDSAGLGEAQRRTATEYDEAVRMLTWRQRRPAGAPVEGAPPPNAPTVGYVATYFPGTTVAANAARVRVTPGDVREAIDIPVDTVRMSRITGIVRSVDSQPTAAVQMSVDVVGPPLPIPAFSGTRTSQPAPDGTFAITNAAPGSYRITVRSGGITLSAGSMSIRSDRQTEWAVADIVVQGSDVDGVVLQLQPGLTFSGSLVATGQREAPLTWKNARVTVQPARSTSVVLSGQFGRAVLARSATVNDDGTFEVTGLQPDNYEIAVTLPPSLSNTWTVKSVRVGDRDLRDAPLTFEQGSMRDVQVVVTDLRTELAGTFLSAIGQAATDYYVVIFPADRKLWHPLSPRMRLVRPDADGAFSARDLPAGGYRIAALTDIDGDEWQTAAFLEVLFAASIAVTVTDGQTTRQDVRIR